MIPTLEHLKSILADGWTLSREQCFWLVAEVDRLNVSGSTESQPISTQEGTK